MKFKALQETHTGLLALLLYPCYENETMQRHFFII
jgi:hypothetical protein